MKSPEMSQVCFFYASRMLHWKPHFQRKNSCYSERGAVISKKRISLFWNP